MPFSPLLTVQELKERQETPDAPEALTCIPSLHLSGEACAVLVCNAKLCSTSMLA